MKNSRQTTNETIDQGMQAWFQGTTGQRLVAQQQTSLSAQTRKFHGDSLLWLGCHTGMSDIVRRCMIRYCFFGAFPSQPTFATENWSSFYCDFDDLPVPDGSFDAVVVSFGLAWCRDPRKAVRELARAVRPGGRVVIASINPYGLTALGTLPMRLRSKNYKPLISAGKLTDWLTLLGFDTSAPVYRGFPVGNLDPSSGKLARRSRMVMGRIQQQVDSKNMLVADTFMLSGIKQASSKLMRRIPLFGAPVGSEGQLAPAAFPVAIPPTQLTRLDQAS